MGLAGSDAQIYLADPNDSTTLTDEGCDAIGSGSPSLWWQVTDSQKGIWDPATTFTVEVSTDSGSSWSTASTSTYELHYLLGVVEFTSDPFGGSTSGNDVRVDGAYLPKVKVIEGFETEPEIGPTVHEVTRFQDSAPRLLKGLKHFSGSFGTYRVLEENVDHDTSQAGADDDGPTLREILFDSPTKGSGNSTDPNTVFRFQPNDAHGNTLGAWVQFSQETLEASIGDPQSREFAMEVDQQSSTMSSQTALGVDALASSDL